MQRKASASRPKQALVRFLNASRQPIGTGCLTANGLIVTSAHVVRAALGLTKEQAIGARPRGVLTFDFPFLDSDSVPPQPANASEKTYQAEVAPGGWGWMKDGAHGNDIAILKLIGDAPFVHGRMFAEAHATDHDLVVWLQGFPTDDTDAGKIDATLKAHGELPDGRLTLDFEDSLYILNPGCSGAPVFRPDGHAAIGIFIGRPHHLEKAHRDRNRIAYAVPASRINALLDAVTNAQAAEAAPEEIARIRSLIPSLQNHLQKVVQEANDPRILRGLSVCLDDIDATLEKGFGKSTISDLADYIGEFDGFHHEARTEGLDYRLSLGVFDDTRRSLDEFKAKCGPPKTVKTVQPTVGNSWSDVNLTHRGERDTLLEKIESRLQALDAKGSRVASDRQSVAGNLALKQSAPDTDLISMLSPEVREKASKVLRRLRRELHKDPVSLAVIDKVRADLESLERSLFQELIVLCQTLLGHHAEILSPGQVFRDFRDGPEMVVIKAGKFMMGSPEDEPERGHAEGPQHEVTIPRRFAMGRYTVTFDEWLFAVAEGGCDGYEPDDHGWGHGDRPVVDVSWDNAQVYVQWLSGKTGKIYRLPSEAEWEYAARAGTTGPFSFEGKITTDKANYDGNYSYDGSPKGEYREKTVPARSFAANKFGLYQVHGNVWEWCEDLWHDGYEEKPEALKADGGAWTTGDGSARVLRGGAWNYLPSWLRSAVRFGFAAGVRFDSCGFRLARTL